MPVKFSSAKINSIFDYLEGLEDKDKRRIVEEMCFAEAKLSQLNDQSKLFHGRQRDIEQQERERRRINLGAILEGQLENPDSLSVEQVQELLKIALSSKEARQFLRALV